jgi:hypothetical protein
MATRLCGQLSALHGAGISLPSGLPRSRLTATAWPSPVCLVGEQDKGPLAQARLVAPAGDHERLQRPVDSDRSADQRPSSGLVLGQALEQAGRTASARDPYDQPSAVRLGA